MAAVPQPSNPTGFDYKGLPGEFTEASQKRAERIRHLCHEMARNVIAMGLLLKDQREAFGSMVDRQQARGADTWSAWCHGECGFTADHAARLIKIAEKFDAVESTGSLGYEVMKILSADNTPADLVKKVVDLASKGELPTIKMVKEMKKAAISDARPTPTEAKEKAKATGEVVIGSDDKFYTPLPEDQERDYQERMSVAYETIDAINLLAGLGVSADAWLRQAEQHWLNDFSLGSVEDATTWLQSLADTYKKENGIVDNGK